MKGFAVRCGSSFLRMWLFVKKFLINCADLCIKYTQYDDRGIAQLVEHRSPKPSAEGSIPSAPAKTASIAFAVLAVFCMCKKKQPKALGECRALSTSAACGRYSEAITAQRSILWDLPQARKPGISFRFPGELLRRCAKIIPRPMCFSTTRKSSQSIF